MIYCIGASWKAYFHVEANSSEEAKKKLRDMDLHEKFEVMDDDESIRIYSIQANCWPENLKRSAGLK
jgi:hypothetical protein